MDKKINLFILLSDEYRPIHWPKSSIHRLESIKRRVVNKCEDTEIETEKIMEVLNKITRESLCKNEHGTLKPRTLRTYRSVLIKFIAERITNKKLSPWQASTFF